MSSYESLVLDSSPVPLSVDDQPTQLFLLSTKTSWWMFTSGKPDEGKMWQLSCHTRTLSSSSSPAILAPSSDLWLENALVIHVHFYVLICFACCCYYYCPCSCSFPFVWFSFSRSLLPLFFNLNKLKAHSDGDGHWGHTQLGIWPWLYLNINCVRGRVSGEGERTRCGECEKMALREEERK